MAKRYKLSRRKSGRAFSKATGIHPLNVPSSPMRGGFRM